MKNKYEIREDIVFIHIKSKHGNIKTIIDVEDLKLVGGYKNSWCINYKKGRIDGVRMKIQENGIRKQIWLHRVVLNCPFDKVVDHIDGDTLNNRKTNLRVVTNKENATNLSSSSSSKSKYRNIYFEKGKYGVRIANKRYGRFDKLEDAIACRNYYLQKIYPLRNRND